MSEVTMLSALIKAGYTLMFEAETFLLFLTVTGKGLNSRFVTTTELGASSLIVRAYREVIEIGVS